MTSVNGSNVHEAFALMATLLAPRVPMRYLELSGQVLQRRQMEEVFEERAAAKRCAFPACENPLAKSIGKFRVSLARKEIYDAHYERQFCSPLCLKVSFLIVLAQNAKARLLLSRLSQKPPQLVPSLVEVFGTDKPNPLDYEDDATPVKLVETPVHKPEPMPKARSVWAKTQDLGIVERKHTTANAVSVGVPPALESATSSQLKENASPAAPDRNFPTVEHATLIDGYIFPAHKQKLAKKVEKLVKKSQEEEGNEDDIVVSDSDESDAAASDVSSADSFEISDFDDEEVVTLNDLPLFSHLWGLLSGWITHETTLLVAGLPVPAKEENEGESDPLIQGPEKIEADAARRHARQIRVQRWNSLSLMLRRPLPQVALKLKLASDRFANHRIDRITETFTLRDAIDTRNAHQWACVATILLLVAYDIKPKDLLEGERSEQVKTLTKLDTSEIQQLLQLFYDVRKDSDVAVDTDVAPVPENEANDKKATSGEEVDNKPPAFCRKCRRAKSKCACKRRAQDSKGEEFSTAQVEEMLQEALVLRDEYDELLQPDN
ncbi:putative RNA polymerase II subunit B1 CTD phosphatase RPAP2 [Phytophthora citrophthora]|uniref:RNA polymerase II subunit B1 CTD phosphatase RPAP2 homolog n=1 Tax=Phytophthora citrophthora TaxID=4793 RepID=A0AAD9G1K9_9STRA|nr:putative RNA polymerase II subunit B1 CTD phosphatase RPAP2 [Phytophthora citrophthora]